MHEGFFKGEQRGGVQGSKGGGGGQRESERERERLEKGTKEEGSREERRGGDARSEAFVSARIP